MSVLLLVLRFGLWTLSLPLHVAVVVPLDAFVVE
jgi:hypothetical protein